MKTKKVISTDRARIDQLYQRISSYIDTARQTVMHTVDTEMVKAYWLIGKDIVEEEQQGKSRAGYGESLLKQLSIRLEKKYARGFSVRTLEDTRKFYLVYPHTSASLKSHAVREKSKLPQFSPNLGWIHYRSLMRVSRPAARTFYEKEAIRNGWSGRELERQIASLLFDRLAKSRDKKGLIKLASKGHEIITPGDAIKEPMILEFLGLPESHRLVESKLEQALIHNLQHFLLD